MELKSGDSAVVPEFELPHRARKLLSRILWELVQPCRQSLADADQTLEAALEEANAKLARVKAGFKSGREQDRVQRKRIESQISMARAELAQMRQTAQAHLEPQGVQVPQRESSDSEIREQQRSPATTAEAIRSVDSETISQAVAPLRSQLEVIQRLREPLFWPASPGARWAVVVSSLVLFFTFYPLVLTWPAIFFGLRILWVQRASVAYESFIGVLQNVEDSLGVFQAWNESRSEKAEASAAALVPPAVQEHGEETSRARTVFKSTLRTIMKTTSTLAKELHREEQALWTVSAYAGADWGSPEWESWNPDSSPEFAARIGTLSVEEPDLEARLPGLDLHFRLPALIPFANGECLLFNSTPQSLKAAAATMQSVLIRVLANTPPGKARFTLVDPVGLGQNVAEFMGLGDYDEKLISGKAWSEPRHVEQQLSDLTEHMETVIQKYLRTDFASIQEYNATAHEVAEPFRFLVVLDFPVNFSEAAARRLVSVVRNGPRCGVYTFIVRDTSKPLPHGFNLSDLERSATIVTWNNEKATKGPAVWTAEDFAHAQLTPDTLAGHRESANTIVARSGEAAVAAMKVEIPFDKLTEWHRPESMWRESSAERLRAPLGPSGARKVQVLTFGDGLAHHGLIVGRTGSGKTNLMHVLIAALALTYSPEEVQLYLVDFKGGVGFKPYAEHRLPHAAVIAIESEREFGISVLQGLDRELQRRFEIFRAAGVDNIADYRKRASGHEAHRMPRVVLVVDEYQEFFSGEDAIATLARTIFERMVRQGRSFGLHILLGTQSLSGSASLPTSIMGQMAVRIALPCSDADACLVLANDNAAARSLSRPGEAIYNGAAGAVEGNNPFQVAMLGDSDLQKHLKAVSRLAQERGIQPQLIIFEGNEPSQLPECQPLLSLVEAGSWAPPPLAAMAWLGEPIAILPPVAAVFRRQTGKHLLIVTRDEAAGVGVLYAAWLSLLCQHRPTLARFYVLDLSAADSWWAPYSGAMRSSFAHESQALDRRNIAQVLESLAVLVRRRIESPAPGQEPVFLFIQGLQRARDLRPPSLADFGARGSQVTPAELLAEILRDGPEAGVHVLAWCDTVTNARRTLDRSLAEFGMRLAGPMSVEESSQLLDCGDAARLDRPHRLLFLDEDRPGIIEKLRPYSLPSLEWLNSVAARQRRWKHE